MASHTSNGKRRRLEARAALSKPFKSPLRRPNPALNEETAEKKNIPTSTPSNQTTTPVIQRSTQYPLSTPVSVSTTSLATPSLKRTSLGQRLTPVRKPIVPDPEMLNLQKEQRMAQARLSTLRSELDTVQQALRIESSNREEELEGLVVKWKKVSQDAAEEVFTGAQERISRMGGVKGWRERMRNDCSRWEQEELGTWFGNVDSEGADMDESELKDRQAEMREKIKEKEMKKAVEQKDEPEEFTMDMMLKTLNVDLKLIGYDKSNQVWIKG